MMEMFISILMEKTNSLFDSFLAALDERYHLIF